MNKIKILLSFTALIFAAGTYAQPNQKYADGVVAVIGENMLLRSDIENELYQSKKQYGESAEFHCQLIEQLMVKKLLLQYAQMDSLPLSDERVDGEIDNRLRFYARQLKSEDKLEKYLGMPLAQYKKNIRPRVKEQLLSKMMEDKIMANIKVSPKEVKNFYDSINYDSLPVVGNELEVGQIILKPKMSVEARQLAREKIEALRKRVMQGQNFDQLAKIYSDDPGSARDGGKLPEFGRGEMVPQFERIAFKLKNDSVSEVFESDFGYHFIKMINRRGEKVMCRHILIRPQITNLDVAEARIRMDSIYKLLINDSITFCNAVKLYSDDKSSKAGCGFYTDETTGLQLIPIEAIDEETARVLANMKPGEFSQPSTFTGPDGTNVIRIVYLKSEVKPHKLNPLQDYQKLQILAMEAKKQKELQKWVSKKLPDTYIQINTDFMDCPQFSRWLNVKSKAKL